MFSWSLNTHSPGKRNCTRKVGRRRVGLKRMVGPAGRKCSATYLHRNAPSPGHLRWHPWVLTWWDPASSDTGRLNKRHSSCRVCWRGTTIGAKGILNRNQGPIWRLCLSRRNEMTTITSSMDRRSGRRMPTMQTACSVSCEPTSQASPSKASPSSFSRCRHPVSPSIRSSHWRANMN